MINRQPKDFRILAIAPSTSGFGFAVLEEQEALVDWGTRIVNGDKNAKSVAKVEGLIAQYQPDALVLPDVWAKNSRRSPRIKELLGAIIDLAKARKLKVALFSPERVKRHLLVGGQGTKHALAESVAQRFEAELGSCLPPKRSLWKSEARRMNIFEAVALALALRLKTTKSIAKH